jgi:uncharacterized protein YecT (DUF1311 family)
VLLQSSLPTKLKSAVDRWRAEVKKLPAEPIIPDYDVMAHCLTRLFEVRHIICHELPSKPAYVLGEVGDFLDQAVRFVKAFENVLTYELYGLTPLTQTELNIDAQNKLQAKEEELRGLISSFSADIALVEGELSALEESQEKWLLYRDAYCDFVTILNKGGTIRSLIWSTNAQKMTESRMADLRSWFEFRANL